MKIYADTNFFTRLYLELPEHRAAVESLSEASGRGTAVLPITWLHQVELINAFQLHVFAGREPGRTRVTAEQAAIALAIFREHVRQAQFLQVVNLETGDLLDQFEVLSLRHTPRYGFRTYDLVHVSSALILECDSFWSYDPKANKLAGLEGLTTLESKPW